MSRVVEWDLKEKPSKPKKHKNKKSRFSILKIAIGSFAILIFVLSLLFILVYLGVFAPVPSAKQLQNINNPVASEVLSADGKVLGRYYIENRSNVKFEEISKNVINALIATEDSRFYEHRGIDEIALLRVFVKSILMFDRSSGGGSTISQQLAKNLFPRVSLGPISMPVNKMREAIIAYRMERVYNKNEILTLYLNTVPFAENIFGIGVAAERYFSKRPKDLDVHEAAVIVGMLKANNYYNPHSNPERAKERRNVVIDLMEKNGYITAAKAKIYKDKPLILNYRAITYTQGPSPYFADKLRPQLLKWCASHNNEDGEPYNLYTDGLKIRTTLDFNMQIYAQQSVNDYMKNLQGVFNNHWKGRDLLKEDPGILKSALRSRELAAKDMKEKIHTSLFTWNGLRDTTITRLDSVKHYLKFLNAGFIAIDPYSGALKAWVGGIDFRFYKFDHVTAPRQTGSSFKPFVYLAALENGISPDKYYANIQKVYNEFEGWSPKNSHDDYGGYYTMKGALTKSLNTVSVEVLLDAGISNAVDVAEALGISADLPEYPSLALGVASVSLQEMAEAYAGIVNEGKPVQMHYLLEISDHNGKVLEKFDYPVSETEVVLPENCRTILNMMQSVVDEGTGSAIRSRYNIQCEFAGKTGTTQENSDGWFIGITPNLVTGCWVGADDPRVHFRTINYGQGAYMALPIVGSFFSRVSKDPKLIKYCSGSFNPPSPEILAKLEVPEYTEVLEIKKDKGWDLADIFHKKEKQGELKTVPKKEEPKKDIPVKPEETKKEKEPVWNKIKNIFKKKENLFCFFDLQFGC